MDGILETLRSRKLTVPLLLVFVALLVQTSWAGDDAFITMRVIDNFVHGYGLRWNINERVQTYTHPLWMFMLSAVYVLERNPYLALMGLSIFVSALAFLILLLKVPRNNFGLILASSILILSKAFVDYSSSGLENPATHLLLLGFVLVYLQEEKTINSRRIFWLSLFVGLSAVNRLDSLLFFIPVLFLVFWQNRSWRTVKLMLAGFSPLLLWEIFSLVYYGFLLPNTYYAKLDTGVPVHALVAQGLLYFLNSLGWDPITLTIILSAIFLTLIGHRFDEKSLALGLLLYLAYIVYIGGDFMSGRFFTAPLFLSVILLVRRVQDSSLLEKYVWIGLVLLLGIWLAPLKSFADPLASDLSTFDTTSGIADERFGYYRYSNLLLMSRDANMPLHPFAQTGKNYHDQNQKFLLGEAIGMTGYFAGPQTYFIDPLGLADPLLARLPVADLTAWRSAHFERKIPDGYMDSLVGGTNRIVDPNLATFYDKLRLIVSGDIWSTARWEAVWKMNTGQYDYLLDAYVKAQQ